jgi:hypothetical protein
MSRENIAEGCINQTLLKTVLSACFFKDKHLELGQA